MKNQQPDEQAKMSSFERAREFALQDTTVGVIFATSTAATFIPGAGAFVNLALGATSLTFAGLQLTKRLPIYDEQGNAVTGIKRQGVLKQLQAFRHPKDLQIFPPAPEITEKLLSQQLSLIDRRHEIEAELQQLYRREKDANPALLHKEAHEARTLLEETSIDIKYFQSALKEAQEAPEPNAQHIKVLQGFLEYAEREAEQGRGRQEDDQSVSEEPPAQTGLSWQRETLETSIKETDDPQEKARLKVWLDAVNKEEARLLAEQTAPLEGPLASSEISPASLLLQEELQEELQHIAAQEIPLRSASGYPIESFEREEKLRALQEHFNCPNNELGALPREQQIFQDPQPYTIEEIDKALQKGEPLCDRYGAEIQEQARRIFEAQSYAGRHKYYAPAVELSLEDCQAALSDQSLPIYSAQGKLLEGMERKQALETAIEGQNRGFFQPKEPVALFHERQEITIQDVEAFNMQQRLAAYSYLALAAYSLVNGIIGVAASAAGPLAPIVSGIHGVSVLGVIAQSDALLPLLLPAKVGKYLEQAREGLSLRNINHQAKKLNHWLTSFNHRNHLAEEMSKMKESQEYQQADPWKRKLLMKVVTEGVYQKNRQDAQSALKKGAKTTFQDTGVESYLFNFEARLDDLSAVQNIGPIAKVPIIGAAVTLTAMTYFCSKALLNTALLASAIVSGNRQLRSERAAEAYDSGSKAWGSLVATFDNLLSSCARLSAQGVRKIAMAIAVVTLVQSAAQFLARRSFVQNLAQKFSKKASNAENIEPDFKTKRPDNLQTESPKPEGKKCVTVTCPIRGESLESHAVEDDRNLTQQQRHDPSIGG